MKFSAFWFLRAVDDRQPTEVSAARYGNSRRLRGPVRVGSELDEEPDHQGDEEDETGEGTELGDEFREAVELDLERGGLGVAGQCCDSMEMFSQGSKSAKRGKDNLHIMI